MSGAAGRPLRLVAAALMICLTGFPGSLAAVDCSLASTTVGASYGAVFNLSASGFSQEELETSIDYWDLCSGYGSQMPSLMVGGTGGIPVQVNKVTGRSTADGGGCGRTISTIVGGRLESAVITVWTQQADGTTCVPLTDPLAHELGHVYGLTDATDAACIDHIMGQRAVSRIVYSDDCEVARGQWITPFEPQGTAPAPNNQVGGSPLVIDLDRRGFRFTDLAGGVEFDLDVDGVAEKIAWLAVGSQDGFLVLDRDGDGEITSGAELFGDGTAQPPSAEPNGFLALALFDGDAAGGNRNGAIDPGDGVFPLLQVWIDEDHDGRSRAGELHSLESVNVRSIDLGYVEARRRDRHGNQFRYKSLVRIGRSSAEIVDVFFLREAQP